MPDPISRMGSPGQMQSPASVPNVPAMQAGEAVPEPIPGLPNPDRQAEAVHLEIAQGGVSAKNPPAPTIEEAAKAFQDYLENLPSNLQFRKDEQTGIVVFKVVNPITREVIRQYPPDEVLAIARHLRQFAQRKEQPGILLDQNS